MKIVIGHKNLNLEELFNISYQPIPTEVIVDNTISHEFDHQPPKVQQKSLQAFPAFPVERYNIQPGHERAIYVVKLLQLIKLKRNVSKQTVNYFVQVLNENRSFLGVEGKTFFQALFEDAHSKGVYFGDKELFVLQAQAQLYQTLLALEVYKLKEQLRLLDTALVFSLETLNVHSDYFTEYALTLGKQTQGINNFRSSVQALVDKSKLVGTQAMPSASLQLSKVYQLHGVLHERLLQLAQTLQNEINNDFGSLFAEKKYKELMSIANSQQEDVISSLAQQTSIFLSVIPQLTRLSILRNAELLKQKVAEESKQEEAKSQDTLAEIFESLSSQRLINAYIDELLTAYIKNKTVEDELKAKAAEAGKKEEDKKEEVKKDQRGAKKKGKEAVTSVQFGTGTRKFFDYLLYALPSAGTPQAMKDKLNILRNKELESTLNEALEQRNEERRKPKCAKGTRDMLPLQMAIREKAFATIKGVFKRHGATEIDTPVFELKETLMGKYGEESKLIYDLEDQGGELLSLRYDLTVPFARYVALNNLEKIKRFHIAKVYRRDNPQMNKGRFREFYQCDFDIAGAYSLMIPDAEVLKVVTEILTELNIGGFVIKINHRKFLDAMVELSGCEKRKFKAICSSVDKLDKESWENVRKELITMKGLTEEMCDKLEKFVVLVGKPWELLQKLKDDRIFAGHQEGEETIKEMELLFQYLESMNCLQYMSFDFSLARGLDYYTGLIYEAVLTDPENKVGSIAGGGRYDGLVGMFSGKAIPAVGVSIGIERVFAILETKYKGDYTVRATETQIYVAQIGKNLTAERLKICNELWSIGIKAETPYNDVPKTQRQLEYTLENGIPLIIWLGENEVQQGVLKVKSLNKHEEYILKREEFLEKIVDIVRDNPILLPQAQQQQQPAGQNQLGQPEDGQMQQ